jgi:hypothetical protein
VDTGDNKGILQNNIKNSELIHEYEQHKEKKPLSKSIETLNKSNTKNVGNNTPKKDYIFSRREQSKTHTTSKNHRKIDIPVAMTDFSENLEERLTGGSYITDDKAADGTNIFKDMRESKNNDDNAEDMDEVYYESEELENKNTEEIIEASTTISSVLGVSKIASSDCVACGQDIAFILQQYCTVEVNNHGIPTAHIDMVSVQKYLFVCGFCKVPYHFGCASQYFQSEGKLIWMNCKNCKKNTSIDHN